ncbi:MAG: DUF2723 domain-containing protein [Bacteroidales bacterium]|jgi:hypothetical protein|nr:DUF2723 domain-containing protein [Bacteroidales bacterium]
MKKFHIFNNITGWAVFIVAALVYILTSEPTVSLWDCGEYISTAFKLQVGHPPGAPLFQIIGRIFSLFAMGDTQQVARMINTMSALASAFTILFLFWSISMLARKAYSHQKELKSSDTFIILSASAIGSLAFMFTDSFWFSAVEGEVYAMSACFTAMVFWAILKWDLDADKPHADRWLILIAYLIGLSIGVHLLNLLAIPAIALVYYFKKYEGKKPIGIVFALGISIIILAFIMYGIIPETLSLFARAELLLVNSLGLPFNSGSILLALLIITFLVFGIRYSINNSKINTTLALSGGGGIALIFLLNASGFTSVFIRLVILSGIVYMVFRFRHRRVALNTVILSLTFILIGYSSFLMLVIRANAGTPINENKPSNAISLLSYLNREQYGDWPLLYGPNYNTEISSYKDGNPVYSMDKESGRYIITDKRTATIPVYNSSQSTLFPRMWENMQPNHAEEYKAWAGIEDPEGRKTPSFGDNLRYMINYQVVHMYYRYFMWNFAGRQNDAQGRYDKADGNWICGIPFIDNALIGNQSLLPAHKKTAARNTYYLLPLLLGLAGMAWQYRKSRHGFYVVLAMFLMTGLAIVFYLNQYSPQPRERDYAYAVSFMAFGMWIGLGVLWIAEMLRKIHPKVPATVLALILSSSVPIILGAQNWDDHNRSGRYTALQSAKAYLDSCAPNAILFTIGDNDTFPLWYAQEVEGYRTDVRVCNVSLLGMDWYIDQMKTRVYDSPPLPISLENKDYRQGTRDVVYLIESSENQKAISLKTLFRLIKEDEKVLKYHSDYGELDYFPTKSFTLDVDTTLAILNGFIPLKNRHLIESQIRWKTKSNALSKSDLAILDIIAHFNWERPIYFASSGGDENTLGLGDYLRMEGMAYRLVPYKVKSDDKSKLSFDTDIMYSFLMDKFNVSMNDKQVFYGDDNVRMISNYRNLFATLAEALLSEGQEEKAIKVCDKAMDLYPAETVGMNYFIIPIAGIYLQTTAAGKGIELLKQKTRILDLDLNYYMSMEGRFSDASDFEKRQALAILNHMMEVAENAQQPELQKYIEEVFSKYYQRYLNKASYTNP